MRGAEARLRVLPTAGGDSRLPLAVHGARDARVPRGDPAHPRASVALPPVLLAARRGGGGRGDNQRGVLRGEPDAPRALPRRHALAGRGVPASRVHRGGTPPHAPPSRRAVSAGPSGSGRSAVARARHHRSPHSRTDGAAQVRCGLRVLRLRVQSGLRGAGSSDDALPAPPALPVRAQDAVVRVGGVVPLPLPAVRPPDSRRAADDAAPHVGERAERGDDPVGAGPRRVGLVSRAGRDVPGHGADGGLSVLPVVDAVSERLLLPAGAGAAEAGPPPPSHDAEPGERRGSDLPPRPSRGRRAHLHGGGEAALDAALPLLRAPRGGGVAGESGGGGDEDGARDMHDDRQRGLAVSSHGGAGTAVRTVLPLHEEDRRGRGRGLLRGR